jgi:hypothetical protein
VGWSNFEPGTCSFIRVCFDLGLAQNKSSESVGSKTLKSTQVLGHQTEREVHVGNLSREGTTYWSLEFCFASL